AGGVQVLWSRWFLAYLPCSLITIFIAWRLMLWFFPPEKPVLSGGEHYVRGEIEKMGSWAPLQSRAALLSLVAMALWLTDFIHGVSPSVIGLGIAFGGLALGVGVLTDDDVKWAN